MPACLMPAVCLRACLSVQLTINKSFTDDLLGVSLASIAVDRSDVELKLHLWPQFGDSPHVLVFRDIDLLHVVADSPHFPILAVRLAAHIGKLWIGEMNC